MDRTTTELEYAVERALIDNGARIDIVRGERCLAIRTVYSLDRDVMDDDYIPLRDLARELARYLA